MGFFDTLFGGGAEKEAANKNRALYGNYLNQGNEYLNQGYVDSSTALSRAKAAYDPLAGLGAKYGAATTLGLDSLGVSGADGNARARAAFAEAPGTSYIRDQALEAVNRRRATAGMWNSGNNDIDLANTAGGIANQSFGDWQKSLLGFVSPELSATSGAASGAAGAEGGLAELARQFASDRTNLYGNYTSGNASANNSEAAGKAAGAKNVLGAGLGLASLAMGGMGGLPGMGGAFGFGQAGPIVLGGASGPGQFRT